MASPRLFLICILALASALISNAFSTNIGFSNIQGSSATSVTTIPNTATSTKTSTTRASTVQLFSTPPNGATNGEQQQEGSNTKPDLVDQTVFRAAVNRIQDEIEAQYQAEKVAAGTANEPPTPEEQAWLEEQAKRREDENTYIYLVGKLDVTLPIDTQPELDLTESTGPLVLVTNCWGRTAEATGIQEFDTITVVSVDDPNQPFLVKTKCTTLEETAGALTAAAQHAINLGKREIQLEVQRLIKGYYAPEDSV